MPQVAFLMFLSHGGSMQHIIPRWKGQLRGEGPENVAKEKGQFLDLRFFQINQLGAVP
jgi:hypothetical protein